MDDLIRSIKNWAHLGLAGAAAVRYGFPAKKLSVIGVTGTDGKTTTSTLIYHFLKSAGYKAALISTVGAYIGDEAIDTGFHVTSPDSKELQRLLKHIADQGFTHVVLESTSHGLDQHRLLGTWIKTAVVTNITHEHLDYHKTMERYIQAKAKIFQQAMTAVINHDDESYEALKAYIKPSTRWIAYSTTYEATRNFPFTVDEYDLLVKTAEDRFAESYNISNTLAAAVAAYTQGVSVNEMTAALKTFPGIPGRMELIPNSLGITAIVDFAHTPNALEVSLRAARKITSGKVIAVFGAAGKRDATKRPLMGKAAAMIADEVILTSEDPRTENPQVIIQEIKSGITSGWGHVHGITDRRQAIALGLKLASAGDVVIVCGKGHEQSMNLDGVREIPWSDAKVMKEELRFLTNLH